MARQLRAMGFDARALAGGYAAWASVYPVDPIAHVTTAERAPG